MATLNLLISCEADHDPNPFRDDNGQLILATQTASWPVSNGAVFVDVYLDGEYLSTLSQYFMGEFDCNAENSAAAISTIRPEGSYLLELIFSGGTTRSGVVECVKGECSKIDFMAATGSNGGGNGNCTIDQQAYQKYFNECSSGFSQAPCYCAAAAACKQQCQFECEQENRAYAAQLGTTCVY